MEISGSGYSRGGYGGGDRCPDYVPLLWSDPGSITVDGSRITWHLLPKAPEPHEISPDLWLEIDGTGFTFWDYG